MPRKLTADDDELIRALYRTQGAIRLAERFGVHRSTIYNATVRLGIDADTPPKGMIPLTVAAFDIGVSPRLLHHYVSRAPDRTKVMRVYGRRAYLKKSLVRELRDHYAARRAGAEAARAGYLTIREAARELGISPKTVRYGLRGRGAYAALSETRRYRGPLPASGTSTVTTINPHDVARVGREHRAALTARKRTHQPIHDLIPGFTVNRTTAFKHAYRHMREHGLTPIKAHVGARPDRLWIPHATAAYLLDRYGAASAAREKAA